MNINKERCRYYSELLAKLADGTHNVEESGDSGESWGQGASYNVMALQIDDTDPDYLYRTVEIKQPPKTVTVYIYKGDIRPIASHFPPQDAEDKANLIKTVEINLDDATDTRATTQPKADNGIDWDALPAEAQWVATDLDGCVWWYEDEPRAFSEVWGSTGKKERFFEGEATPSWRTSLQRRPRK